MPQAVFISVLQFLAGASYPLTRDELVRHALQGGAGLEALAALQRIPDRLYGTSAQVSRAVAYS